MRNGSTVKAVAGGPRFNHLWLDYMQNVSELQNCICSLNNANLSCLGICLCKSACLTFTESQNLLARCQTFLVLPEFKLFLRLEVLDPKQVYRVFQTAAESFWIVFSLICAPDCSYASSPIWHILLSMHMKEKHSFICCQKL